MPKQTGIMYVSIPVRDRLKAMKGKGKTYERFLLELMDDYEHRSPSAKVETGNDHVGCEQ